MIHSLSFVVGDFRNQFCDSDEIYRVLLRLVRAISRLHAFNIYFLGEETRIRKQAEEMMESNTVSSSSLVS